MDTRKMKAVAQWLHSTVFKDEPIRPRADARPQRAERLPAMLRTARSLENHQIWQSRESVFFKQAKLLAAYEDDYDYRGGVRCYYPTYQSLSDQELRGYFSWRTKLRRGDVQKTSLSFAFLYIYELLNQIGVTDPMDGYRRLADFRDVYGQLDGGILSYLDIWMVDYAVYYELDPALLDASPQVLRDRSVTVLEHIRERDPAQVMDAVRRLSPKWLARSKFYAARREDMDAVTVRVLRRVSDHCASRCKKTMVEQYFGDLSRCQAHLFDAAVFCDPLKKRNCEYVLDEQCVYRCENGLWSVSRRVGTPSSRKKLDALLKTIDSMMREECAYGHPVQPSLDTKWLLRIIQEEIRAYFAEKEAAEARKVAINYAQLSQIRRDAAATQEKLIVEEELDPAPPEPSPPPPVPDPEPQTDVPLDGAEYRLLQCLLYGGDTGWVQTEGYMLSVLADGINEKLYDIFQDSVLDDAPQPLEDYIDELKEMVRP